MGEFRLFAFLRRRSASLWMRAFEARVSAKNFRFSACTDTRRITDRTGRILKLFVIASVLLHPVQAWAACAGFYNSQASAREACLAALDPQYGGNCTSNEGAFCGGDCGHVAFYVDPGPTHRAFGYNCGSTTCPIEPIPRITNEEVQSFEDGRIDRERLTPRMQTALQCLEDAVRQAGATSSLESAYRPPGYQQHFIDVWKKWAEIRKNKAPACQTLKSEVERHLQRHELIYKPSTNSDHTRGEAIDVGIDLPAERIDVLAEECLLRRPLPQKDRTHFIHR